jgi:hypothetical protein
MRGTKGPALQALKDVVERQVRGRRAPAGQSSGPLGLLKERNSVRDWEGEAGEAPAEPRISMDSQ